MIMEWAQFPLRQKEEMPLLMHNAMLLQHYQPHNQSVLRAPDALSSYANIVSSSCDIAYFCPPPVLDENTEDYSFHWLSHYSN